MTAPGGAITTLTYDATGLRRTAETVAGTTKFVWDGQNVLLETDAGGTTQAAYTQTADGYGALISQRRSGATQQYHFDALGSTMELSDAAQTVTDTWRYQAFGETRARTGTSANPFGFVGELGYYQEADLGLHYVRARWYEARTGRWVSEDPVSRPGQGLYGYVGNRPTRSVDPSGRWPSPPPTSHECCQRKFRKCERKMILCEFCMTIADALLTPGLGQLCDKIPDRWARRFCNKLKQWTGEKICVSAAGWNANLSDKGYYIYCLDDYLSGDIDRQTGCCARFSDMIPDDRKRGTTYNTCMKWIGTS